jgi:hypothetical protein
MAMKGASLQDRSRYGPVAFFLAGTRSLVKVAASAAAGFVSHSALRRPRVSALRSSMRYRTVQLSNLDKTNTLALGGLIQSAGTLHSCPELDRLRAHFIRVVECLHEHAAVRLGE